MKLSIKVIILFFSILFFSCAKDNGFSSGSSICPTTSNCGCSGKNKAPCQADPCCKWVVGSGCECA